ISLIPVKWDYYTQNKYLQNDFVAVDNIQDQYEISLKPESIAVKGIDGHTLFYLHRTSANTIAYDNFVSLWLRIIAGLLVLLNFHQIQKQKKILLLLAFLRS